MSDSDATTLAQLRRMMRATGVRRLYVKFLAANDNSKNQPYFGGGFAVLNILPSLQATARVTGSHGKPIFEARLRFSWLDRNGRESPAPEAKLLMYPQYPEVRFSGYLRGSKGAPSDLMGNTRVPGRLLFLGITDDGRILGYAAGPYSAVARETRTLCAGYTEQFGVFLRIPLSRARADSDRESLLSELSRIHQMGWIRSKRLNSSGATVSCNSPNCGGFTLEAELGITPNGYADPDFKGWEIKQHKVRDFSVFGNGPITLMTPEPTGGYYARRGTLEFVRKYGYADLAGRPDRWNFGGKHQVGIQHHRTGLELRLNGYDRRSGRITDPGGGIALVDASDHEAASWNYAGLMAHWNRKHATAAYVPSMSRMLPERQYCYGPKVRLGTGTDFLRFLRAMACGRVYYDPGIKVESVSRRPRVKKRSQFRIGSALVGELYDSFETVHLDDED